MRKSFLMKFLALFLTGTVLVTVGCKNYDDDINDLRNRVDELATGKIASMESQLAAMQKTVDNLKAAEEALGKQIDELKKDVTANATAIAALELAQEQLKNDIVAIKANYVSKDFLTTTLGSYATINYVSSNYAKLSDLGVLSTEAAIRAAIEKARLEAIAAAGTACAEAFQGKFDAAVAAAGLVNATKLTEEIEAYDVKIKEYVTEAIEANNGVINEKIATAIADAKAELTAELKKWVSGRLTSLSLIPETYTDGIETIDIKTLNYTEQLVTSNKLEEKFENKLNATPWYFSEIATPVRYHVSPSVVTNVDVKAPSFLFEQVKTRAAFSTELVKIIDNAFSTEVGKAWDIKNSEMTIQARRVASAKTLSAQIGINYNEFTVALQVPIADNLLQDGETGTVIYSDYAMLAEQIASIKIAALRDDAKNVTDYDCVIGNHKHFYATYANGAADALNNPNATCDYNSTIDLLTLVTGCAVDEDGTVRQIKKDKLAAAGLAFRFAVPTKPFERGTNNADQQQYIKLDGSIATPTTPTGAIGNRASIDKTPVVRVELIDTKHNDVVVDVCYIQLKWTEPSYEFDIPTFNYTLGCQFNKEFTWLDMNKFVLEKMNMSQGDFVQLYSIKDITTKDNRMVGGISTSKNTDEIYYNLDGTALESVAAFEWMLNSVQMGEIINYDGTTKTEYKDGKVMNVTINLTRKDGSGTGDIKVNFSVKIVPPALPCTVNYMQPMWFSDYTYVKIEPLKISQENPAWQTESTISNTVDYLQPMAQYFVDGKPLSGMNDCALWDMQFAKTQPVEGYAPALTNNTEPALDNDVTGYTLKKGAVVAVELKYDGSMNANWYGAEAGTGKSLAINGKIDLPNTAETKALLGKSATAKIWGSINPQNRYCVKTFDMQFIAPLKIENKQSAISVVYNAELNGQSCLAAITMTDFMGNSVKKGTGDAGKYYQYYAVQTPVWGLDQAIVNIKDGAVVDVSDITPENFAEKTAGLMKANDLFKKDDGTLCFSVEIATNDEPKLTYKPMDSPVRSSDLIVLIPLKVTHKWGEATVLVKVTVTVKK